MKRRDISGSIHARRPLRKLFMEGLESRTVMSVCGVTCELTDGMLNVQGTTADDLIAVRYDAAAASVSVVGRNDEVIGQYLLADVRGLDINGLGGNDQLHVDSSLHDALGMTAAEGENSAASGSTMHSHGSAAASTNNTSNTTSSPYSGFEPALAPSLAPSLNSLTVSSTAASPLNSTSSANLSVTATVADHGAYHVAASVDVGTVSHVHDSPAVGAVVSLVSGAVSMAGHSHAPTAYHSASASGSEAMSEAHATSPVEEFSGELKLGEHEKHEVAVTSNVGFKKLVAKPCTVSYSGGLVVTSVDGKRQCNCDQKKQAAEEVKQQLAGKNGTAGDGLATATVECVPCQQAGIFAVGLPKEFQTCSSPMSSAKQTIALPVLKLLDEHHGGAACPTRSAAEDAVLTETAWLESLQYVGWPLVAAATAALVPAMFERRKKNDEEDEAPALDWLFGRLQVEPLLAR